ncbi:hydantoinase/carbamoylase family amidase [Roseospira marina]|uniref:Hydantoinase/carbamoylase family amidase n=1 Tax=Roseospira marina TaxID=140057 RepID=A0A5M6IHC3_9PROT|nr:hydantoinase/carbamoylase family amidase [Roseospira marina]KAA5607572.1 hydantoinase/carbamoylase family amidase [Roseospira marina]MBB4312237.1 N-carbamoyl-L-amino-acid hydrolase [Roseospira marina]MBB5085747.1 N-carbamoyl-L-amino-acid hydrolase [Roseospira marina]
MTRALTETIDRVLDGVNAISAPGPGVTRPSYDPLESRAHAVIAEEAGRLGLTVERDAALNLFARLPGRDRRAPALYVGSHLDSVPQGGRYDGPAGVAGAMALAAALIERDTPPPVDLVVTVTRAEESVWFPASYIGSRAATGRLRAEDLAVCRADTGRTLADHMRAEGGDPDAVLRGPGRTPATFLEPHIEQGPVLVEADEPFALVTAIRGGLRYRTARIAGTWAHSGGAPRHSRADVVFALADVITAMDRHWAAILAEGHDLAVTVGRVDAAGPEHAFAKVPGALSFCIDLRSNDTAVLDRADAVLRNEIAAVEAARGVTFDLGAPSRSVPTPLSADLTDRLHAAFGRQGRAVRRMLSGGGHDAAAFAQAGWTAGMLFIRNQNGSHNPDEAMDRADLAEAIDALAAGLVEACAP